MTHHVDQLLGFPDAANGVWKGSLLLLEVFFARKTILKVSGGSMAIGRGSCLQEGHTMEGYW